MEHELVAAEWGGKQYVARVDEQYNVAVVVRAIPDGNDQNDHLHAWADDGGAHPVTR